VIEFILDIWTLGLSEAWARYRETSEQKERRIAATFADQMGISYQEAFAYLQSLGKSRHDRS
jgi:hypothetical protein